LRRQLAIYVLRIFEGIEKSAQEKTQACWVTVALYDEQRQALDGLLCELPRLKTERVKPAHLFPSCNRLHALFASADEDDSWQ
jgi:hypothetical protein